MTLLILSSLLYFFRLGSFSLYDAAETTYGEFVKNILNTGDWITLHYNGGIIFDKPPLFFWLAALLSKLIGFNEWAMRFFAALAGVLTVITTYFLGKTLYNERAGFYSGIVVMTAFQFLVQSRIAELDIVLTFILTLSIFLWYQWYLSGNRTFGLLAYFPLAFGLLIKGILAVALPAFTVFLFLLFKKELKKLLDMRLLPGILIILAIGLPWYVIEYIRHGKAFLDFAFGFLFLSRFQGVVSGHTGPWYYYFFALLLGFAPWSHFLPLGLWQTWKLRAKDSELLTLCFIVPAFIVFSIAKTKIPNYVLPLYPFLAIMVGKLWDDLLAKPEAGRRGFIVSNIIFAFVIALILAGFIIAGTSNYPSQYDILMPGLKFTAAVLIIGSLFSIVSFFLRNYDFSFASIPVMVFAIAFVLTVWILPGVETFKGAKPLGRELAGVIKPGQQVAAYKIGNRPSVVLYSPKKVLFLRSEKELARFLREKRGYCFTLLEERKNLKIRTRVFDQSGDLVILL